MYFVITNIDGYPCTESVEKDMLKERINSGHYGQSGFIGDLEGIEMRYWGDNILIIKGDIVMPKTVENVKEYEI